MRRAKRWLTCLTKKQFVVFVGSMAFLLASPTSASPVAFDIDFQDVMSTSGAGFHDPILGAVRREQVTAVATRLGQLFDYPDRTIVLHVRASESDGTGEPAIGATCRGVQTLPGPGGFFQPRSLVVAEVGAAPICADGGHMNLLVDFGFNYDYDSSDGTIGYDFETVMTHELVHGLGYGSDSRLAGGTTPYGPSTFNAFRSTSHTAMSEFFTFDAAGNDRLWNSDGDYLGDPNQALDDGEVFFNADGLSFPLVRDGKDSFSDSGVARDVMAPPEEGVVRTELTVNDRLALDGLGWGVVQVPEPSSRLLGLFVLAMFVRWRKVQR